MLRDLPSSCCYCKGTMQSERPSFIAIFFLAEVFKEDETVAAKGL